MSSRNTHPDPIFVHTDGDASSARPRPEKLGRVVTSVRNKVGELSERYRELDELLVGCLANDTGQAEALSGLGAEVQRNKHELARIDRLVEALARVVRAHHRDNKRRDAELALITRRQDAILAQLSALSRDDDGATLELCVEEKNALLARVGVVEN